MKTTQKMAENIARAIYLTSDISSKAIQKRIARIKKMKPESMKAQNIYAKFITEWQGLDKK